jgi:hypothetical protein
MHQKRSATPIPLELVKKDEKNDDTYLDISVVMRQFMKTAWRIPQNQ